jgi:pyruvate dehydrogenase E2 component (dihydrolipoamide acetyltransferase)
MPDFKRFPLPDVGEGLTEAEILSWHVQPGDDVTVNQVIVEIETAKAAVELPSPYAGRVSELLAEPGQTVTVGTPIIVIDADPTGVAPTPAPAPASAAKPDQAGEKVPNLVGYGPKETSARRRPRTDGAVRANRTNGTTRANGTAGSGGSAGSDKNNSGRIGSGGSGSITVARPAAGYVPLAKPPVRKLARELGIDLHDLAGSGMSGVITRDDVERAATEGTAPVPPALPAVGSSAGSREPYRVPIRGVRRATAAAMVASAFTAPHVTEFLTVDVTPMMAVRAKLKSSPPFAGIKLTPLVFAAKAVCLAVRRTPDVNASWDEAAGEIVYQPYVHLGIAATTPRGLVVPKIRDADLLSLRDLAVALDELAGTARAGRTPPADMLGGTITISNIGVFGVDTGTPIINPGESAILAFGAIREMPWVVDGQVVPRQVCQLALSFDHRVVNGEQGSRFLADVGALLADPAVAITY